MLTRADLARTRQGCSLPVACKTRSRARASAYGVVGGHSRCAMASPIGSADHAVSSRASERIPIRLGSQMTKKPTGAAAGDSEAMRIYERMEEERLRKIHAKAEANRPKKVTLPKLKFLDEK